MRTSDSDRGFTQLPMSEMATSRSVTRLATCKRRARIYPQLDTCQHRAFYVAESRFQPAHWIVKRSAGIRATLWRKQA